MSKHIDVSKIGREFVIKTPALEFICSFKIILHSELIEKANLFDYDTDLDKYMKKMSSLLKGNDNIDSLTVDWFVLDKSKPANLNSVLPMLIDHAMKYKADIILVDDMEYVALHGNFYIIDGK